MNHGFIKGVAAGAVMGVGIAMMMNPMDQHDKKRFARNTSKMFTTLGSVADNIIDMCRT